MARRRRARTESSEVQTGELNIVPFLDIVVNIMLFMLATSTAAMAVAQVEVEMPGMCVRCDREHGLSLSVTLADRGIIVAGRGGVLSPGCESMNGGMTIARARGRYDFEALTRCLERVHQRFPNEDTVILTADPEIPYEDVIAAMDASRGTMNGPLFPRVLLSAGAR